LQTVVLAELLLALGAPAAPIIGGQGKFRYMYMPDRLQLPEGVALVDAHGLVTDADGNIILTYHNDGKTDPHCLIKWAPNGTGGVVLTAGSNALCDGTAHGLKIATETTADGSAQQFLYHANNNQKLSKTTLDGSIVWQRTGTFGQDPSLPYRPTWFAIPPTSKHIFLCDGYGSNNVYAFDRNGNYLNYSWGGRGDRSQHGKFSTNHGCTYDPRVGKIAVSDRANSRIEYFDFDDNDPSKFEYAYTSDMLPQLGAATLPCNLRMYPAQEGRAVIPDLSGPVAVLDDKNSVLSVVNVSVLLAKEEHKHPHDAIFLANGDIVVATWAPGRLSYWRLLH